METFLIVLAIVGAIPVVLYVPKLLAHLDERVLRTEAAARRHAKRRLKRKIKEAYDEVRVIEDEANAEYIRLKSLITDQSELWAHARGGPIAATKVAYESAAVKAVPLENELLRLRRQSWWWRLRERVGLPSEWLYALRSAWRCRQEQQP